MFDAIYLLDVSCRLHLLARDCFDFSTAAQLSKMADEMRARADEAEYLSALVCAIADCSRRQSQVIH